MAESFNNNFANVPFDIFGVGAQRANRSQGQPYYDYDVQAAGEGVVRWSFGMYSFQGGLNKQAGDYDRDWDRLSTSTLDFRFGRHGLLNTLVTIQTTPDPSTPYAGIHFANIFGTMMVGIGDDDPAILKETSATNPALAALSTSYDPGDNQPVSCLVPLVFNGVSSALRLVVGRVGAIPQVITAADGTLYGTSAHASLSSLWGAIGTFTGDLTATDPLNLWYAGTSIYKTHQSDDIDAAPEETLSGIRGGGYAIGLHQRASDPFVRAFWFIPKQNTAAGALLLGSEVDGDVFSTNVEGIDPVPVPFKPYLPKVSWADKFRRGIIASDLKNLWYYDGIEYADTEIFSNPPADSDKQYRIRGCGIRGGSLRAEVERQASPSGTGNTVRFVMEFDFDKWSWQQVSAETTLSTTGNLSTLPGGSLPWSDITGFTHNYIDGKWYRQLWTDPGVNPFSQRKTNGAQSSTGIAFAASGAAEMPSWELPGLQGWVKEFGGAVFMGDLESGDATDNTSHTSLALQVMEQGGAYKTVCSWTPNHTFPRIAEPQNARDRVVFDKFQPKFVVTQGSGGTDPTLYTPNILPVKVWGYAYAPGYAPPQKDSPALVRRG